MSLKVVVLTTETTHHLYFVWKLSQRFLLSGIFLETRSLKPSFETSHPFENLRDEYERDELLKGCNGTCGDFANTYSFDSVNNDECVTVLQSIRPDVVIVFGTGKIKPPVIGVPKIACLNLHGGNPEHYRGLDNHLWAIYHQDFNNLVTTLHYVDVELDTGDIIFQSRVPIIKKNRLFELRSINAQVCVDLSSLALQGLDVDGCLPSRRQTMLGRYYSFMPAPLKEDCVKKFEKHTERL